MAKITEKKFKDYVRVQESGVTNMFNLEMVISLSGLTIEECLDIMGNYREYYKKFKGGIDE